jgi:lipoprotein LprG
VESYDACMVKRLLVLGVLGLVAVAGCTSSTDSGAPLPDGTALLKDSAQATKSITSAHFALKVNGQVPGLPIKELNGDLSTKGDAQGDAKLEQFGQVLEVQFVLAEKNLYIKGITGQWQSLGEAAKVYDVSAILDPNRGVSNLLANVQGAKTEAREEINGVKTFRIAGKAGKDVVAPLVPTVQSDVDVKFWVREEGDHQPVRALLELSPGNSVEITLSEVGKPVSVTKPV